ncbi:MAG: RNA polymerase sigma factor [Ignavibacteria bacterium]|nr:RNA polymerase sigma factor [Ignavibacteria bacterium]
MLNPIPFVTEAPTLPSHSPVNLDSDEAYWQRFRTNCDPEAFKMLYNRYFKTLFRYGYYLTSHNDAVLDAVQNLFVYIYQHYATLGEVSSVKAYLLTSLRRTLARTIQHERKYIADEDLTDSNQGDHSDVAAEGFFFQCSPSVEELWIENDTADERRSFILRHVNSLPKRQREVIYLHFYEQLSHEQISKLMEVKIETVYIVLHRALKSLHSSLVQKK